MKRLQSAVIFGLLWMLSAQAADPKWIHMKTDHFRVYSSAKERDTRDVLNRLEQVRDFFIQLFKATPPNEVPVDVVIFGSEKEYQPVRLNDFAIAYYSGQGDRDYIVIGKVGESADHITAHEYTHLYFRHINYNLPPWLGEGVAELFSNLETVGKNIKFGEPIAGRMYGLQTEKWVPLATILTADQGSPYYNESKQAGSLYNQGWALTHMLFTTNEYRSNVSELLQAISAGTPSIVALERFYGPLPALEKRLQEYITGNRFHYLTTPMKLAPDDKIPATPVDAFTVKLLQADLLAARKPDDARERYEALKREDASRPEPWTGLGYIEWRANKHDEAIASFAKAYDLGGRNPKMLYDYARLDSGTPRALDVMKEYVKLDPTNVDARLDLLTMLSRQNQPAEALAMVRAMSSVKTEAQRDRALYMRAALELQAGERDQAKKFADELLRLTTSPDYRLRGEQLQRALTVAGPVRIAQEPQLVQRQADAPANVVRPNDVAPPPPQTPQTPETPRPQSFVVLQSIDGKLVEMDCREPARMIVENDAGKKEFLVLTPNQLVVTGRGTGPTDLSCGKQEPAPKVHIRYMEPPEGSSAAGVVRTIDFQQ